MRGLFQLLKEILFPRVCAACGSEIDSGLFCAACRKAQRCLKTLPAESPLDGVLFLFSYEGEIRRALRKIKFSGNRQLPGMLAEEAEALWETPEMLRALRLLRAGDNLVPPSLWCGVPTDPKRLQQRGFDLPTLLFANRAAATGGRWQTLLCRTRCSSPMYGLTPEERRRNLLDCFAAVSDVRGKSIVLTDDIFTTGATFTAAARVLKQAGAKRVQGLAFCGAAENLMK